MSVEQFVISALVQEGSPKRAFQSNVGSDDFEIFDEEWQWIVRRAEQRRPINSRIFKKAFPEFEFIRQQENIGDLLDELKQERAYVGVTSAIDEVLGGETPLDQENAIEKAMQLREVLGDVVKMHGVQADVLIKAEWETQYERVKQMKTLLESGQAPGIPTGLPHFDIHWGGLQGEASYLILGRPGDAKSFTLGKFVIEGAWSGYRMGMFSPEMTQHQHYARFHTLLSAKDEVQKALGLKGPFNNRALKEGHGFNLKQYRKFLEWLESEMPGEICLFTQKYRREKMGVGYIRSRVEDAGLDAIIIDPIYKLKAPKRRGTRWEELQEIVDSLTNIAHEFNIPVVMSNQAGRASVGRRGDAPDKDSSFGADAPVQEADTVVGVKHFSDERLMLFNCDKNRHGESFKFKARFVPNKGILNDVTPIQTNYFNGHDPEKVVELSAAIKESGL
jgi:DnaB-like helicase C terminal domain